MIILLFLLLFLTQLGTAEAVTKYVRNGAGGGCANGSTNYIPASNTCAGGGTDTVYTTIQNGIINLGSGNTLEIRAGTYNESLNIYSSLSGTSFANGVIIRAFAGETVTVVMTSGGGGIDVGANFATIGATTGLLKFNGQNLGTPGNCQHNIGGNGTNVRFYNVDVYDNARLNPNGRPCSGMKPGGVNWLISGSRIYGNGGIPAPYKFTGVEAPYGFYWPVDGNGGTIENSEIYDNACIGIQIYSTPAPANVTLRNNRWYRNGRNCYDGAGNPQNGGDVYVVGNGHLIQGNVFYDGSTVPGPSVSVDPGNTVVQYNTFYNLNEGVSIQGSGQTYRNNIFSNITQGAFRDNGNTATRAANLCFATSDTGTGTHCQIVANPQFVNAGARNFALLSTSPARGAASGTCAGITDIAGVARPQDGTCDIGAYEFSMPPVGPNLVVAMGFDEGTGTAVKDISGRNNNGTFSTGVSWTTGKYGAGLSFNGTGGVTIPDSSSLNLSGGMTLMAWVKPVSVTADAAVISKGLSLYYLFASLDYCGTNNMVGGISGSRYACYGPSLSTAGIWQHIAVTYSQATGQILIYLNGVNVTSAPAIGAISADSNPLRIGSSFFNEHFTGDVDEIRIYDGAINQDAGFAVDGCVSAQSIVRDMNCSLNPITTPPASASGFKVGTTGSKIIGVGGSYKTGN